jgi:hypothetical protein
MGKTAIARKYDEDELNQETYKRCHFCHKQYPESRLIFANGTYICSGEGTHDCFEKLQNNGCRGGCD